LLHAASQHWSEATALIERGRKLEMPRSLRARYEKLREAIAANATPPR
jgi:hypothetical protein